MDIKPGYMLGAKPRQQALGHVIGIFAGAAAVIPVFYLMVNGNVSMFTSDIMPMPAAQVWKAVAEMLAKGFSSIHPTARWAMLLGAVAGIAMEWANLRMRGSFPLSGVAMGLATVVTFPDVLSMSLGSLFFWAMGRRLRAGRGSHRVFVENRETLCAGIIAGGALIGIILILLETLVLR
jgi:uncharacterized oligopeptide transporter (OPT) family protein